MLFGSSHPTLAVSVSSLLCVAVQQPNRLSKHSPPVEFNAVSKAEFAALEEADKKKREELGIKSVKSSAVRGEEDDLQ